MIKPIQKSIFLTKPIIKMPKGLIYNPSGDCYLMIESKTGKVVGKMFANAIKNDKSYYTNKSENDLIFHISSLEIEPNEQGKGWGEYFMDFAKNESIKKNCKKRLSLVAYNYEKSPHAFYYKQGFVTLEERTNIILDEYVKNNWIPFHWDAMEMYLPEEDSNITLKTVGFKAKFLIKIKNFFKSIKLNLQKL